MKKQDSSNLGGEMDRQSFLKTSGLFAGGMGSFALAGCALKVEHAPANDTPSPDGGSTPAAAERLTEEVPTPPDAAAPSVTSYDCNAPSGAVISVNAKAIVMASGGWGKYRRTRMTVTRYDLNNCIGCGNCETVCPCGVSASTKPPRGPLSPIRRIAKAADSAP